MAEPEGTSSKEFSGGDDSVARGPWVGVEYILPSALQVYELGYHAVTARSTAAHRTLSPSISLYFHPTSLHSLLHLQTLCGNLIEDPQVAFALRLLFLNGISACAAPLKGAPVRMDSAVPPPPRRPVYARHPTDLKQTLTLMRTLRWIMATVALWRNLLPGPLSKPG